MANFDQESAQGSLVYVAFMRLFDCFEAVAKAELWQLVHVMFQLL